MRLSVLCAIMLALLLIVCTLCFCLGYSCAPRVDVYELRGIVSEIDVATDSVLFTDARGNVWSFAKADGWTEGDLVVAFMCDGGTSNVTDDEIISVYRVHE